MALNASDIKIIVDAESAKASAEIKKLTKDLDKMNKTIKDGGKVTEKNVSQMTRSFKSLTAHVSKLAIIYGTFKTLMTGTVITAQFEQSIKKLGVFSGSSAVQLTELSDKAKDLGESTIFSASQVAEGMNEMALAGLSSNEMLDGISDVLNLASVGMISLKDATDFTVTSMKAFGLESSDINDITDVFAKTSTISATNVTQLGQALSKVGQVAHTYNVSLEETSVALGILADSGRRGSEAGTQLKIVMQRLAGNKEALKYIEELTDETTGLKLSMYDASGALLPFDEQLRKINQSLSGLDEKSRNIKLAEIFGSEASASAIALLNNLEDYRVKLLEVQEAMANDFATKSAKVMVDTLIGSFKNLQSALEGLAIKIVGEMTPALRGMLDQWTETIRGMDEDEVKDFADALTGLVEGVTSVTGAFASFAGSTIGFISNNKNLVAVVGTLVIAVKVLRTEMIKTFVATVAQSKGSLGSLILGFGLVETRIKSMIVQIGLWKIATLGAITVVVAGLAMYVDKLQATWKARSKLLDLEVTAGARYSEIVNQIVKATDYSTGVIGENNVERAKLATSISKEIGLLEKELTGLKRGSLTFKEYTDKRKVLREQLDSLYGIQEKIGKSWVKETVAVKKATDAQILNNTITKEAIKNYDKFDKALQKRVDSTEKAISKIIKAEQGLVLKQAKVEADRLRIISDYADKRLQIVEDYNSLEYEGRTADLEGLAKHNAEKLRIEELLAKGREALSKGAIDEASRYYAEAKSMASSFAGQVIEENGKVLISSSETYKTASDIYKTTKQAELVILDQKKIAELQANKQKLELIVLELKGQKALLEMQDKFLEKLTQLGDKAKDTKAQFDEPSYFQKINEDYDKTIQHFEDKALEMQVDIDDKIAKTKLANIDTLKQKLTTPKRMEIKVDDKELKEAGKSTDDLKYRLESVMGLDGNYEMVMVVNDDDIDKATRSVENLNIVLTDDPEAKVTIDIADVTIAQDELTALKGWTESDVIEINFTSNDEAIDDSKRKLESLVIGDYKVKVDADTTPLDFGIAKLIAGYKKTSDDKKKLTMVTNPEFTEAEKMIATFLALQKDEPIEKKVVADVRGISTEVEKEKVKIESQTPIETKVSADTTLVIDKTASTLQVVSNMVANVKVDADTSRAYTSVVALIRWINSQSAKVNVGFSGGGSVPQGLAGGGVFTGSGSVGGYDATDSDGVNARLTGGEFVINRSAVDIAGLSMLNDINDKKYSSLKGYATGGLVGGSNNVTSESNNFKNLGTLNLNVGGKTYPALVPQEVADALQIYMNTEGGN